MVVEIYEYPTSLPFWPPHSDKKNCLQVSKTVPPCLTRRLWMRFDAFRKRGIYGWRVRDVKRTLRWRSDVARIARRSESNKCERNPSERPPFEQFLRANTADGGRRSIPLWLWHYQPSHMHLTNEIHRKPRQIFFRSVTYRCCYTRRALFLSWLSVWYQLSTVWAQWHFVWFADRLQRRL